MYSENEDFEEDYNDDTNNNESFGDKAKNFYESNKKLCIIAGGFFLLLIILLMFNSCSNNSGNQPGGTGGTAGGSSGGTGSSTDEVDMNLSSTEEHLSIGNSVRLLLHVDIDYDIDPVWISSNPEVASVDQLGNVNALELGTALITVSFKLKDNEIYKLNCNVIVAEGDENVTITDVSFPDGELLMTFGDKYQLLKQITPSNGYITDITYTSSNPSVATVDNQGVVKSLKEGVTTIRMYVNNSAFTDELIVNVVRENVAPQMIIYPTNITFDNPSETLVVGARKQLTYQFLPNDAYTKSFEWSSSNPSVVTVDSDGEIIALSEGNAIITVKSKNDISAAVNIIVESAKVDVTSINLISSSYISMNVGNTSQIITNVLPSNATDKSVTYSSSNSSVAYVDSNGLIIALSPGAANITVKTNDKGLTANIVVMVNSGNSGSSSGGSSSGGSSGGTSSGGSSSGGTSSGGSGSGGSSTACTGDNIITITSNSGGAIMTQLQNAQNSSVTVTKNQVTIYTDQIGKSSCGTIKNAKYCYQTYSGYKCIPNNSFAIGNNIVLNIPKGNDIMHFRIEVTMTNGDSYSKDYYFKYNVSTGSGSSSSGGTSSGGSSSSTTKGCYCCGSSQGCTYSWGTGGSNCVLNPNMTEKTCVGKNPASVTASRTIENYQGSYTLCLVTLNSTNYLRSVNFCIGNQGTCTVSKNAGSTSANVIQSGTKYYSIFSNNQTYTRYVDTSGAYNIRVAVSSGQYFCYLPILADGSYGTQSCIRIA